MKVTSLTSQTLAHSINASMTDPKEFDIVSRSNSKMQIRADKAGKQGYVDELKASRREAVSNLKVGNEYEI